MSGEGQRTTKGGGMSAQSEPMDLIMCTLYHMAWHTFKWLVKKRPEAE
jgi:hypothetical protein